MKNSKTLYLIDGYAALFRAFYAIRNPLHSPVTGEPTQAVLVFAQMLLKLYTTLSPDYVVVAWDMPGKTFRDDLFAQYADLQRLPQAENTERLRDTGGPVEPIPSLVDVVPDVAPTSIPSVPSYKGTRRETPDSLHAQTPRILQLLEIFGIPVIGKPGLEADDVIATLTARVLEDPAYPDVRVRIVTRDKDLEQRLGERVTLFDIHTGLEMDEADLWTKRGITPAQVVDFLALTGDVIDNIPGVAGIGPKTAAKLLQQFGSLQGVLQDIADNPPNQKQIPDRLRESLERARPVLPLSRRLITLEAAADIPFVLEDARAHPIPAKKMEMFCDALGFYSLKKQCLRSVAMEKVDSEATETENA